MIVNLIENCYDVFSILINNGKHIMPLNSKDLLQNLNSTYLKLHQTFEELFWVFKMGDHSVEETMNQAEKDRDLFRSDARNLDRVKDALTINGPEEGVTGEDRKRLEVWQNFFRLYQTPSELTPLRDKIAILEGQVAKKFATRTEGYKDPKTGEFVSASKGKIRMMMRTNPDETVRKACFDSLEAMSLDAVGEFVELVAMRNEFARALKFPDFYAYKLRLNEGMDKSEVFDVFDEIHEKTRYAFGEIRALEAARPGLRKPWNFAFMMSGSFTLEEDPYYIFDEALPRWGRSFAALGINYRGGQLQLDLLDRQGKYNNGFCHYPNLVNFEDGKRNPGSANFTCNAIYGQVGSGHLATNTLFHEAGHAADRLGSERTEVCLNTEWAPASIAWAETHSQFLDTMFASIEWGTRYAKDKDGNPYPFELFERRSRQMRVNAPLSLNGIMMVSEFEKRVYEEKNLTAEKVVEIAKEVGHKYTDYSEDSLWVLSVPHIYDWESSAYYHSYGLAILALDQWRHYFYEKYGYIVDNPEVGREMATVWKFGSAMMFPEFVRLATGKDLSPEAFLEEVTMDIEKYLARERKRVARMKSIPEFIGPVELNAKIRMVHGKELIADNSVSFEDMARKYKEWLRKQIK